MDKPWKVFLAFTGIFLAGTVSGLLIAPRLFQRMIERRWQQGGASQRPGAAAQQTPQLGQLGPLLWRRVTEKLDLTPEQKEKIRPTETRTTQELLQLRRDAQRSTALIIERMQIDIAAVLTPEQKTKFDELVAKDRERMEKFMQSGTRIRARRDGQPPASGEPVRPRDGPPRDDAPPK